MSQPLCLPLCEEVALQLVALCYTAAGWCNQSTFQSVIEEKA